MCLGDALSDEKYDFVRTNKFRYLIIYSITTDIFRLKVGELKQIGKNWSETVKYMGKFQAIMANPQAYENLLPYEDKARRNMIM